MELPKGSAGRYINFDTDGNLVVFAFTSGQGTRFMRHAGGEWQPLRFLGIERAWLTTRALLRGRNGALHFVGRGRRLVPTILSVPAGNDPLQLESWVWKPPSVDENSGLPSNYREPQIALDWPRQTVWAAWTRNYKVYASPAPIGSAQSAVWSGWEVGPQEDGSNASTYCLAASNGGSVGMAYLCRDRSGAQGVRFHWLMPNGPGERHDLVRPGTQTEAADFRYFSSNTLCLCIAPDGTAHVLVKGNKRGEHPEDVERLYYSRISGGAVLANEPDVVGGGQQTGGGQQGDWTQAGGKPDLSAGIELNRRPYSRDGVEVYRYNRGSATVSPTLRITNHGSQYFGDVDARIIIDGVTINYRWLDDSNRMRPLVERDGTITEYQLPSLRYEFRPQQWEPPTLDFKHGDRGRTIPVYSGLGRKRITVIVDPDNKIDELSEDNNVFEMEYEVSWGDTEQDLMRVTDNRGDSQRFGFNDLAILGSPKLSANTKIAAPGLLQRPTTVRMIVGNPRGAMFFRDVAVAALLDGQEVWRHTIPLMDNERTLYNRDTQWYGYTGPPRRSGPEVMGGFVDIPIDLTDVAVGAHTLTLVVDPEDSFADLDRDNNSAGINFRVREPGGSLRLSVRDRDTNQPLPQAHVFLPDLYFGMCDQSGQHTVADLPPGNYQSSQLLASRPYPDPAYGQQPASSGFTITRGQETDAVVLLEAPVHVIVTALDAQTGEPVHEPMDASLKYLGTASHYVSGGDDYLTPRRGGHTLHFIDVPPGMCEISAVAYAFGRVTQTVDVHRDANGECRVQFTLPRAPRGQIMGTVVDGDNRPVAGAVVWLNDAPRDGVTDNAGNFTLTDVQAGRDYQVIAMKKSHLPDRVMSGTVQADGTRSVLLRCRKLTSRLKSLSVDCVAWAQVESWPGFSFGPVQNDSYEVSAEHGKFSATMGMLYRDVQGEKRIIVDAIVLGTSGKEFWNANISTKYSLSSVISTAVEFAAGKDVARLVSLVEPLNDTFDFLKGDVDPSQMRDGEVVGTYSSQTGTDFQSVTLIPMPDIPLAVGFHGGQTVVRTDILEIRDAYKTKTIRRQWYSPQTAAYNIDEEFDPDSLEVRFSVAVLNDRLSPGPLYAGSRNVLWWKPLESNWLRFEPSAYDALGLD
jgi:hypothetical protein